MKLPRLVCTLALALALVALAASSLATAQTAYTLGVDSCSHGGGISCYNVPIIETGTDVWINIIPVENPISSRFILRIPDFPTDSYAGLNAAILAADGTISPSSPYQVQYANSVTYKAPDGRIWIADCNPHDPCPKQHTLKVPQEVTDTFYQVNEDGSVPSNPLTGVLAVSFGNYRYVDQCSGRGCGGTLGWHWSTSSGQIVVNAPQSTSKLSTAPKFELASFHPQTKSMFKDVIPCCGYPPGIYTCEGIQGVVSPWKCGQNSTCEVVKGFCEVSQEGNQWQMVYWTWIF